MIWYYLRERPEKTAFYYERKKIEVNFWSESYSFSSPYCKWYHKKWFYKSKNKYFLSALILTIALIAYWKWFWKQSFHCPTVSVVKPDFAVAMEALTDLKNQHPIYQNIFKCKVVRSYLQTLHLRVPAISAVSAPNVRKKWRSMLCT